MKNSLQSVHSALSDFTIPACLFSGTVMSQFHCNSVLLSEEEGGDGVRGFSLLYLNLFEMNGKQSFDIEGVSIQPNLNY